MIERVMIYEEYNNRIQQTASDWLVGRWMAHDGASGTEYATDPELVVDACITAYLNTTCQGTWNLRPNAIT